MSDTTVISIIDEFSLTNEQQKFIASELFGGQGEFFAHLEPDQKQKIVDIYDAGRFESWIESYEIYKENTKEVSIGSAGDDSENFKPVGTGAELDKVTRIVDEDAGGEIVDITTDMRDEALQVHGQIEGAFWQLATALSRIKNERLYLALGFNSFKGYCSETLPFGVRSAYHYALVGEKIGLKLLEEGEGAKSTSQSLEKVGIEKLRLITAKAEDQIKTLIDQGKITIGDEEYTTEELRDQRVKDLREALKQANEKLEKTEVLEEKNKRLEMEKEELAEEKDELSAFKKKHQESAENREQIEEFLTESETLRERVVTLLNRLDPDTMLEHASEEQMERLVHMLDLWQKSANMQKNKHIALVEAVWEDSVDMEDELGEIEIN